MKSQLFQRKWSKIATIDWTARENRAVVVRHSDVIGEFVKPWKGPACATKLEASQRTAGMKSIATVFLVDMTFELEIPGESSFSLATRNIAHQSRRRFASGRNSRRGCMVARVLISGLDERFVGCPSLHEKRC
jgi:hypothetical protein